MAPGFVMHVGPGIVPLLDPAPLELLEETPLDELLLLGPTPLDELLLLDPPKPLLDPPGDPELLLEELLDELLGPVTPLVVFWGSPGSAAQAIPTQVAAVIATRMGPALRCMDLLGCAA